MADYAQLAQLQSVQNQNQVSQMQLEQMRRDEDTMKQIQAKSVEHGGPADINVIADAYMNSGNPRFIEFGVNLRQRLDDRTQFAKIMGMGGGAPQPAPAVSSNRVNEPNAAPGVEVFKVNERAAPVNAFAALTAAPSINALAAPPAGSDVAMLRKKRDMFLEMGTAQGNAAARTMDAEIALASKEPVYYNVPGVGLVDPRNGRVVTPSVEKPAAPPSMVAEYTFSKTPDGGNFRGSFQDFVTARATAGRTPAPLQPPVSIRGPDGQEVYVTRDQAFGKTPGNSGSLKQIPPNINLAILKNNQSLKQIDETIALLKKNPDATGAKGYLPNFALNRMDPEGTDARAGVADIGSLVLHDRSGAAVTAAEAPRLMPFIPLATDDNATVIKKLTRMRNIAAGDQEGLTETYSKEQGYIPNPTVGKITNSPESVSNDLHSQAEAIIKGKK
jgi:hypothetical protein